MLLAVFPPNFLILARPQRNNVQEINCILKAKEFKVQNIHDVRYPPKNVQIRKPEGKINKRQSKINTNVIIRVHEH